MDSNRQASATIHKRQGWTILTCAENAAPERLDMFVRHLSQNPPQGEKILRNDSRSLIFLVPDEERRLVFKCPREKNRRKWTRFTTLLCPGEAFRTLSNTQKLLAAGVNVPRPVAAMQKSRLGMVTDSWIIYEYAEADPEKPAFAEIVALLHKIHACGRVHADAGRQNFISSGGRVMALDCRTRPRLWGRVSDCYDFVLLANSAPEAAKYFDFDATTAAYRLAAWYNGRVRAWRRLKKKLRGRK